jgi:hypothetical protein
MTTTARGLRLGLVLTLGAALPQSAAAEQSEEDLAKQLANPDAALISVPFHFNFNQNLGPFDDGEQWTLNIQPVIPFSLSADWNLISWTIVPLVHQSDLFPGAGSQSGMGDVLQSLFFSPAAPTAGGWIWGVGPALLLPTGSDDLSDRNGTSAPASCTLAWWVTPRTARSLTTVAPLTSGLTASGLCTPGRPQRTRSLSSRRRPRRRSARSRVGGLAPAGGGGVVQRSNGRLYGSGRFFRR